jgi:hypothetical protein
MTYDCGRRPRRTGLSIVEGRWTSKRVPQLLLDAFTGSTQATFQRWMHAAARAIPDLAALIFSAYCNGIRGDFHPPAS